mmetsp:Transcript_51836/g.130120  ORF Transcript_51836/g.130120 Transcript_51836/m.130120 type:complete len:222 (+) Transcript_51836:202-867(+)
MLSPSSLTADRPKSQIFTLWFESTSTLLGLRSRWMTCGLERCSQFMPIATSRATLVRKNSDRLALRSCRSSCRLPPRMSSDTMAMCPGTRHAPMNSTMLGCRRTLQMSISFRNSSIAFCVSSCLNSCLMATSFPRHLPRCTLPKQPRPISSKYSISCGAISGGPVFSNSSKISSTSSCDILDRLFSWLSDCGVESVGKLGAGRKEGRTKMQKPLQAQGRCT